MSQHTSCESEECPLRAGTGYGHAAEARGAQPPDLFLLGLHHQGQNLVVFEGFPHSIPSAGRRGLGAIYLI